MIAEAIKKAFTFKPTIEEKENVYIPKVQSTVKPDRVDFNEVSNHIHKQLRLKYEEN